MATYIVYSFLKKTKSTGELGLIWKIANAEKWVNRDRVSDYFEDTPLKDQVTVDLLGSDDVRSFLAGLKSQSLAPPMTH